jgi:hypothetical protein
MSTIAILQPELTTEDVSAALRKGLGPRTRCCHEACRRSGW